MSADANADQLAQLQEDNASLKAQLGEPDLKAFEQIKELRSTNKKLTDEVKRLTGEGIQLAFKNRQLDQQTKKLQQESAEALAKIQQESAEALARMQQESAAALAKVQQEYAEELAKVQQESDDAIATLEQELNVALEKGQNLNHSVEELQGELSQSRERVVSHEAELTRQKEELARRQQDMAQLQDDLTTREGRISKLEQLVNDFKEQFLSGDDFEAVSAAKSAHEGLAYQLLMSHVDLALGIAGRALVDQVYELMEMDKDCSDIQRLEELFEALQDTGSQLFHEEHELAALKEALAVVWHAVQGQSSGHSPASEPGPVAAAPAIPPLLLTPPLASHAPAPSLSLVLEPEPDLSSLLDLHDEEDAAAAEPVVEEPEHIAFEPEPVAIEPEPVAIEPEPVAIEPEPVAIEPEPVAFEPEPIAIEPEPVAIEPEPVAIEPEPLVFEPEPVAFEPEPVALEFELEAIAEEPEEDSLAATMGSLGVDFTSTEEPEAEPPAEAQEEWVHPAAKAKADQINEALPLVSSNTSLALEMLDQALEVEVWVENEAKANLAVARLKANQEDILPYLSEALAGTELVDLFLLLSAAESTAAGKKAEQLGLFYQFGATPRAEMLKQEGLVGLGKHSLNRDFVSHLGNEEEEEVVAFLRDNLIPKAGLTLPVPSVKFEERLESTGPAAFVGTLRQALRAVDYTLFDFPELKVLTYDGPDLFLVDASAEPDLTLVFHRDIEGMPPEELCFLVFRHLVRMYRGHSQLAHQASALDAGQRLQLALACVELYLEEGSVPHPSLMDRLQALQPGQTDFESECRKLLLHWYQATDWAGFLYAREFAFQDEIFHKRLDPVADHAAARLVGITAATYGSLRDELLDRPELLEEIQEGLNELFENTPGISSTRYRVQRMWNEFLLEE